MPVGAQAVERQAQGTGAQIGKGFVGQEQEAAVVDDQRQAAAALLLAPADPAVARTQSARGGAKNQHAQPVAAGIGDGVKELLAHGADIAQIMMLGQQSAGAGFGFGSLEQLDLHSGQRHRNGIVTAPDV